ncbi:hypothetical protein PAI11_13240 [Patulibacter medicamentivorans]|uniref:Uncharacterized protein n=1 Tax=Patulibacter medicamentivorans TaxID=1097667 RepID=H0E3F6_9ACTN|nr:hypothetical protein PAI11_13240 [Patulibacter medicamentivorans]
MVGHRPSRVAVDAVPGEALPLRSRRTDGGPPRSARPGRRC